LANTARGAVLFLKSRICAYRNFLGLQLDNHLNWKNHIEQMILKFSAECHAVRSVVRISDVTGLKLTYFIYFHSIIKYGIIAWGNPSIDGKLFTLQKEILRIMVG